MQLLLVLNPKPYDGSDVMWNALRLLGQALKEGMAVKVFLLNDGVELAQRGLERGAEYDLQGMLTEALARGAEVKACGTCLSRRGISREEVLPQVPVAVLPDLTAWIAAADKVLTF
jgi:uncharacterized protein involved in oxidation of intracellular sulfur